MSIGWRAPVFPGDTIRLVLQVSEVDPKPSRRTGRVTFASRVYNQDDRLVSEGHWQTLMLRDRSSAGGTE